MRQEESSGGESDPEKEKQQPNEAPSGAEKHQIPKDPSFSLWCDERAAVDVDGPLSGPPDGYRAGSKAGEEAVEFELLPLHGQRSPMKAAEIEVQTSNFFIRQRNPAANAEGNATAEKTVSVDMERGIHASNSMLKLEELELAAQSSVSASVVLKTLFYILVWYIFSTCLTLYNKKLLGEKLGNFPAPLLMNTFHFTLQAVLSKIIQCIQSRCSDIGPTMTWKDYFTKIVPTALGTALDINLSNASLVFISVTFATMCKSASPIFLLLFAFAFRLENPSIELLGIVLIISFGVLLTVAKETEFDFWGFVFVMLAAVMSGFRWSMTQILLQKETYGLDNPITLMSYVTPMMAIATFVMSLLMDPWRELNRTAYFDSRWSILRSCLLMLTGGALAFFMVLTEYILVSTTSAITVTVAGVVKESVTILVAVLYFQDQFTWLKGLGLLIIMVGVSLFNWYKYEKFKKGHTSEDGELNSSTPVGATKYAILEDMELSEDDT